MNSLNLPNQQSVLDDTVAMSKDAQMQLIPAFYDLVNDEVYISRDNNGSIATVHLYDSLPDTILMRDELSVVSGFLFNGQFVTGDQAYHQLSDLRPI